MAMGKLIRTAVSGDVFTVDVLGVGRIEVPLTALTPDVREHAVVHGVKQKICDAAAMSRDPKTGASASPRAKFEAMQEVANRLLAGSWNVVATGGAGSFDYRLVCRALELRGMEDPRGWIERQMAAREESQARVVSALLGAGKLERYLRQAREEMGATGGDDILADLPFGAEESEESKVGLQ